ncbi:hypothetical protein HanIR_Chr16g0827241 [Helianthus annuus]|nr:hypothetical protein HanIR_Chr16g0827241 [Helianthus annuus]
MNVGRKGKPRRGQLKAHLRNPKRKIKERRKLPKAGSHDAKHVENPIPVSAYWEGRGVTIAGKKDIRTITVRIPKGCATIVMNRAM